MVLGINALHPVTRSLSWVELLVAELSAGRDVELSKDVVEVPFDGSGADVQLLGDFGVRVAVSGQRGDRPYGTAAPSCLSPRPRG